MMDPRTLCYVLSTLTLASCTRDYYEDRLKTLVHTLSKQRSKYGLNFKQIDNKIPRNSDQEPNSEYNNIAQEENIPADNNNEVNSPLQAFNMLLGMQKTGKTPFEGNTLPKPILRMGRKKPKAYKCRPATCGFTTPKPDNKEDDDECGNYYDGKEITRTRKPSVHDDIVEIIRLLIKVDNEVTGYEKLGVPGRIGYSTAKEYLRYS